MDWNNDEKVNANDYIFYKIVTDSTNKPTSNKTKSSVNHTENSFGC